MPEEPACTVALHLSPSALGLTHTHAASFILAIQITSAFQVELDKYGVEKPVDARQYKTDPRSLDFDQLHAIVKPPEELLSKKLRDECVQEGSRGGGGGAPLSFLQTNAAGLATTSSCW